MDLVRAVRQAHRAHRGVIARQTRIVGDAGGTERLNGVVDDLERHVGRRYLDHGDLELRRFVADLVHHVGGLQAQQPVHLDIGTGFGDALLPDRIFDDLPAERGARRQPLHHLLERLFGLADGAHAVMDAAGAETALRDLKAPALAEQDVADGNTDVFKKHLRVAMRRIVETEHRQHLLDRDALGIARHQDLRLLLMTRRAGIGLAHHDQNLTARVADAGRPPFAAVDHVMIAVALDAGFDIGGIRRRHRGLGHQEGGTDLAVHQRAKPLLLVLLGAVPHQHFHVAGIGRRAIEHFRGPADMAHLLGERRVFQIGQSRAAEFIVLVRRRRHEHVPQTFGARLLLQILQDRYSLPALAGFVLLPVDRHGGPHMLVYERFHTVEPFALTVRHVEVHWAFLTFLERKLWRHRLPAACSPQDYLSRVSARRWRQAWYRPEWRCVMRIDIPAFKP